jgi:predicted amidophosphoribosyltransferase
VALPKHTTNCSACGAVATHALENRPYCASCVRPAQRELMDRKGVSFGVLGPSAHEIELQRELRELTR